MSRIDRRAEARRTREWGFRQLVAFRLRSHRATHIDAEFNRPLTQVDIAIRLGRPQSYVSNLELGMRKIDVAELREIASVYAIAIEVLLAEPRSERDRRAYHGDVPRPTRPRHP